ncbi:hypothetical protein Sste5346_006022 [Sporothrix stenoceras]|uniref:ribonuclease Z n=1 Tax=Sporothrix stenoceras TaxID=5173 RepID=A0ABR3Z206_9PEZI
MHKEKRQRTRSPSPLHRPNFTPREPNHYSFRRHDPDYTGNKDKKFQKPQREEFLARRAPFVPSDQLRGSSLPEGLFASSVKAFSSSFFRRSTPNRLHYLLFENPKEAAAASTTTAELTTASTTTSTPTPTKQRVVAPMLNYVQILTAPTADTPGMCLVVHHDNKRYLFGNVAEGTQRACVQQKQSLNKVEEIFLTGTMGWHTAGGLLGMVLTVADVVHSARMAVVDEAKAKVERLDRARKATEKDGKTNPKAEQAYQAAVATMQEAEEAPARSLSIHGGKNLTHIIATSRRFIFRKGMPIKPHEVHEDTSLAGTTGADTMRDPDWTDDNIMVWYVPVFAEEEAEVPTEVAAGVEGSEPSRKRALEGEDKTEEIAPTAAPMDEATARDLVDTIVKHMFDSNWTLDALFETTLHKAKLPAKIFVKDENGHLKEYDGPLPNKAKDNVPDIPVLTRTPWPATLIENLPPSKPARQSMCYIVRNHPRRGKFDAFAAERLGVAKHNNRFLVAGQNVQAADGSIVTPDMVIAGNIEGTAFAVVELPDSSYIDAFLAKPEWTNTKIMAAIDTMFWLLGPGVVADPRVQSFMKQHSNIRHTVASTDTCPNNLALSSAAALQAKHNRIDPERFPIQKFDNVPPSQPPTVSSSVTDSGSEAKPLYVPARAGWTVRLAPQVLEEDGKVFPPVNFGDALREIEPRVLHLTEAARAQTEKTSFQIAAEVANEGLPHPETEVIPLGTGSAVPSKYRNVSSTLVRVPGVGSYLFDCGENTLGSMRRLFGEEKLQEVLRDLKILWISHLHADHHLGTVSVLRAWRDANRDNTKRIMVASNANMIHWLREYSDAEDVAYDRILAVKMDAPFYPHGSAVCDPWMFTAGQQAEFGVEQIDACRVDHCHGALAVVFTWPKVPGVGSDGPLRIAYSGDCRPSRDFGVIGQGATLLIHESTFDDDLHGEAKAKKHSTMGEALDVGRQMKARRVLLTHFSQRYPKIPLFNNGDNNSKAEMQVLVAFDQMQVRLQDFKEAAEYLPALQKLYEGEEMQGRKDKADGEDDGNKIVSKKGKGGNGGNNNKGKNDKGKKGKA